MREIGEMRRESYAMPNGRSQIEAIYKRALRLLHLLRSSSYDERLEKRRGFRDFKENMEKYRLLGFGRGKC